MATTVYGRINGSCAPSFGDPLTTDQCIVVVAGSLTHFHLIERFDRLPERWIWISLATAAEPAMRTGDAQAGRGEASAGNSVHMEEPSKNRGESNGRPGVDRSHGVQQDESAARRRLTQCEERIQGAREIECH
jgi:hypothetical protein